MKTLVSIEDLGDGKHQIILRSGEVYSTLLINEQQGYTLELLRDNVLDKGLGDRCGSATSVKWKEVNGCWVPVAMEEVHRSGLRKFAFTFDWRSVNESIPGSIFDCESNPKVQGIRVLDKRRGERGTFISPRVGDE